LDAIAGAGAFLLALVLYELAVIVWRKIEEEIDNRRKNAGGVQKENNERNYVSISVGVEMVETNSAVTK